LSEADGGRRLRVCGVGGVEAFFPLGFKPLFAPVVHLEVADDGVDPGLKAVAVLVAALETEHAAECFLDEVFAELAVLIHAPAVAEELVAVAGARLGMVCSSNFVEPTGVVRSGGESVTSPFRVYSR